MAIAKRPSIFFHSILLASMVSLVACGGGGGGGGGGTKPPAIDTTPNAISFAPTSNAEPSAVVTSQAITISGINTAAPISISGGEYAIAGGAFTATPGTVTNSQSLVIRITASDKTNTPKEATLTVGGVSAKFTVTTLADTTPDAFSFPAKTEAAFNTEYTSDAITVKGIDVAVPISLTGGTYSINGGAFTSAAGTVSVDQTITVKTTSASKTESTQNVVLTVGGVEGTFAVTTINDTFPPVAEFKFPTPYTMSEASEVKVRGTATDDNEITSVKLLVRSFNLATPTVTISEKEIDAIPKSETNGVKDYSSWTAVIPLAENAENEIKVVATDVRDNSNEQATAHKVKIRQAPIANAFPDENNQFVNLRNVGLDNGEILNRIIVADNGRVWQVDVETGIRTLFIDHQDLCINKQEGLTVDHKTSQIYGICNKQIFIFNLIDGAYVSKFSITPYHGSYSFTGLSLDRSGGRNQLVIIDNASEFIEEGRTIMGFSLDTKEFSLISNGNEYPPLKGSNGSVAIMKNQYLVPSGGQHKDINLHAVISVDAVTGKHSVYADNVTGSGELFSALLPNGNTAALTAVVIDEKNDRVFVYESLTGKFIAIDEKTGFRSLFMDASYINSSSKPSFVDLDLDEKNRILLLTDSRRKALVMIDLVNREKVIISKSENDF
jgi:hypothetical protein